MLWIWSLIFSSWFLRFVNHLHRRKVIHEGFCKPNLEVCEIYSISTIYTLPFIYSNIFLWLQLSPMIRYTYLQGRMRKVAYLYVQKKIWWQTSQSERHSLSTWRCYLILEFHIHKGFENLAKSTFLELGSPNINLISAICKLLNKSVGFCFVCFALFCFYIALKKFTPKAK